jgi:hypothetical protein
VFQLFHQRGFDAIINDDLIGNVLGFAALGVGKRPLVTVEASDFEFNPSPLFIDDQASSARVLALCWLKLLMS